METKSALRARIGAVRDALSTAERAAKSAAIVQRLSNWDVFARAQTVFAFVSTRSEVDTAGIIAAALAQGKTVGAPRTLLAQRRLEFRRLLDPAEGLVPGPFGIAEPGADAPVLGPAAAELILVPGLAFDARGYRVGYGGGFYDRLLGDPALKAVAVGVGFEEQMIQRAPATERDRPVDWIVTDQGLMACGAAKAAPRKGAER